jgi:hypothetical protein
MEVEDRPRMRVTNANMLRKKNRKATIDAPDMVASTWI